MVDTNDSIRAHRRSFLEGTAALSIVGLPHLSSYFTSQIPSRRTAVRGAFAPRIPDNVSDPHLVSTHGSPPLTETRGWEAADRETLRSSLLDLGPDVLSVQDLTGFNGPPLDTVFANRHTVIGRFAYRWGLPHSSGFTRILEADNVHQAWYQDLSSEERWSKPDGTPVDHPKELSARTFDGEEHLWAQGTSSIIPSVFAPGTLDYESRVGSQIFKLGANQLFVDGFELARLKGNDFSSWARSAFRDHLQSMSEERLQELGIDDPATFDIRHHLEEQGIAPGQSSDNPARHAVYREYTRLHHQRHKRYGEQLAARSKEGAPEVVSAAGTTFFGNQAGIAGPGAAAIYLSDAVDEIDIEVDPTLPPDRAHDVTVKTGLAAGRFEKTVRIEGKMHRIRAVDTLHGLDPDQEYPVLMQFQVAQAYAHGGVRGLSLSSWADVPEEDVVNNWVRPDGTIDDSLQRFTDFVRSQRRFLRDVEPANNAVLVVSLPTLIWQRAPQWGRHNPPHADAVRGAAAVLRQEYVPYDVVILDYPPVWEAQSQWERIPNYDLIMLPGIETISDSHVEVLQTALDGDASIVATGGAPDRDAEYQTRDDVRTLLEDSPNGTIVKPNPERADAGPGRESLREVLPENGRQVELDTNADISVNVMRATDEDYIVLHLLNYQYDPSTDSMATRSNLSVTVRDLPFVPTSTTFHTVDGITDLNISAGENAVSLTIPRLDIWGIVVIKRGSSAGAPTTDRTTAEERINEAHQAIAAAEEEGRTERLIQARTSLQNAQHANTYGGHTVANREAKAATAAAKAAYRTPVVGIDRRHNQSNESDLSTLRETFSTFEYREVDSWTDGAFTEVDVLIVPPIMPGAEREYGFASVELDAAEAFVRDGGSLLLLGIHRPKPGFNRLASRFGFTLDGRPINRGQGAIWDFDVESPLSAVTAFTPIWSGRFGTTVATIEEGTVLGRVLEESPTWLTSERPIDERSDAEPPAAGEPVLVGRAYGDGHVVVSGEAWQFVDPTLWDGTPAPLPEQLLRTLGRRARYARRTVESTPTPQTATPTHASTSAERTTVMPNPNNLTDESPPSQPASGFGVGSAIAGLAGFAALARWLLNGESND